MTHYYQYASSLSHSKRHLNACFVHRLKKLCGRVFNTRVAEVFGDEEFGDYVSVCKGRKDFKDCVLALCTNYGIGSDYISEEGDTIRIYLSKPKAA